MKTKQFTRNLLSFLKINCLITSALLIFFSCSNNKGSNETNDPLLKVIAQLDSSYKKTGNIVYLILPNEGCAGCISEAEDFTKKHYSFSAKLRFIFTKVKSVKTLKNKLGKEVMNNENVMIDRNNLIPYPDVTNSIYPMIVYVKDGSVYKVAYQSPKDSELSQIKEFF
jgi:hypothetical protein